MAERRRIRKRGTINSLVCISDTHGGCKFGLCPPRVRLDGGTYHVASDLQLKVWDKWLHFWNKWVPSVCHGEPFAVLLNGDTIDGRHHKSTSQVSQNLADQCRIAKMFLDPVMKMCNGQLYMVRGTEAHVGQSGEDEERLAESLGAIPDDNGFHSRFELWVRVGRGLVHAMHHIGTTGSSHYESTAVTKELTESYTEAGRWGNEPPDVVVRSHRHRNLEVRIPTDLGYGISFCTAGWQLKTPFTYKIPGGRVTQPQIGGSIIRQGDEDLYTRHKVWGVSRPKEVQL